MGLSDSVAIASLILLHVYILFSAAGVSGFSNRNACKRSFSTRLNGIAEWRDLPSGITYDGDDADEASDLLNYGTSARRVPVICATPREAVLPGEKKYFQFYTNEELRLFQLALDRNHGIFALGIIIREDEDGNDIMMSKLQLMEIQEYNMNLGVDFGIFCTAQVIGRASLLSLLDINVGASKDDTNSHQEPLIAICEERFEDEETHFTVEEANEMAREVLQAISKLSDKEQENIDNDLSSDHDVKIVYDINNDQEEDDIDDDDVDDQETRKDRFARAYLESLDVDSRGYISSAPLKEGLLSWKEMNAISWAAFSSAVIPSEDETMRLHAFDQDRLIDRLKLAAYWLEDVVEEVEQESNSR